MAPRVAVEHIAFTSTASDLGTGPVQGFRSGQVVPHPEQCVGGPSAFTPIRHDEYTPFVRALAVQYRSKFISDHIPLMNMPCAEQKSRTPHRIRAQSAQIADWAWDLIGPLSRTYSENLDLAPTQTSILVAFPVLVGSLAESPSVCSPTGTAAGSCSRSCVP